MQKTLNLAFAAAFLLASSAVPANAQQPALTPAQQEEVKTIIRNFLVQEEPELVMKAAEAAQVREQAMVFANNKDKIYKDPDTQVLGNPKGDVMIVEFFDYQCGYCKMAHTGVKDILQKDKNVGYIAKEFPILGDGSMMATRAALASVKQKKYEAMHNALMEYRGALNEGSIMDIATKAGLDAAQLKKDMNDQKIENIIAANRALGVALGIQGTPYFIVGDEVRSGAMRAEDMTKAIAAARDKKLGKK